MSVTNTSGLRSPATPKDVELFAHVEANLYTAVVADSLDELGYHNQAMSEHVRPLFPECRFAGWARRSSCTTIINLDKQGNPQPPQLERQAERTGGVVGDLAGVGADQRGGDLLERGGRGMRTPAGPPPSLPGMPPSSEPISTLRLAGGRPYFLVVAPISGATERAWIAWHWL